MSSTPQSFSALMQAQCADYRRSLPERLAQIGSLWRQVLNGKAPAQALASLERYAHNLAGSGATFGCAAVGDAARLLELAVVALRGTAPALTATVQDEVSRAVEALQRSLPGES